MSKFLPNGTLSTRVHRLLRPFSESTLQLSPTDPMNGARAPLASTASHAMLQPSVTTNAVINTVRYVPRAPVTQKTPLITSPATARNVKRTTPRSAQVRVQPRPAEVATNRSARPSSGRVRQGARSHARMSAADDAACTTGVRRVSLVARVRAT